MKGLRLTLPFFILFLFFLPFFLYAEVSEFDELRQKIFLRRGAWQTLKADLKIEFQNSQEQKGHCNGRLLYQTLAGRMLLICKNEGNALLFSFKTSGREFELFLPAQETVYQGDILTLQDSPDLESYLKPLDLYLALQPLPFNPFNTPEILHQPSTGYEINFAETGPHPARKIIVSEEGDVLGESFVRSGKRSLKITRAGFVSVQTRLGRFFFPKKITVLLERFSLNRTGRDITYLDFIKTEFDAALSDKDFEMQYPGNTRLEKIEGDFRQALAG